MSALATDALPDGWQAFCSHPGGGHTGRWYATAPYSVHTAYGQSSPLQQTVTAKTWPELHVEVAKQQRLHDRLLGV